MGGNYNGLVLPPEKILNVSGIKRGTEDFYELVKEGYLQSKTPGYFFMTSEGAKVLDKLSKGKTGRLEKYSSEKPKQKYIDDDNKSRLEGIIQNIAAVVLAGFGIFLVIKEGLITGAVSLINIQTDKSIIFGGLLIILGIILFIFKKR